MKDIDIITLDPEGELRPLALVDDNGNAIRLVVRGNPPTRFVHAGRAWHATGAMVQPPASPLCYEYHPAEDLS